MDVIRSADKIEVTDPTTELYLLVEKTKDGQYDFNGNIFKDEVTLTKHMDVYVPEAIARHGLDAQKKATR